MFDELVPQLEGAVWISGLEACDDVVFCQFDGWFGCVDAMVVWFDQLDVCALAVDVLLDGSTAFVV